jgi:hypothetical protein
VVTAGFEAAIKRRAQGVRSGPIERVNFGVFQQVVTVEAFADNTPVFDEDGPDKRVGAYKPRPFAG